MPNWCSTNIIITHEDKNKTKELFDKIQEWTSRNYEDNGFGENWLGNIVIGSEINKDNLSYRGVITSCELVNGQINIWEDTAWCPMLRMWQRVTDKHLPGADITFSAEEPGCGIYETNDYDYDGKYIIDIWKDQPDDMSWESQWEASEELVIEFCQEALKTKETDITKLLERAKELDWVAINRWEHCEIEDCE
jgi:hypothetical protein